MNTECKEHYLAEARKAAEMATKAATPESQGQWLRLAESYRSLAKFTEKG